MGRMFWLTSAAAIVLFAALAYGLPADTFYVGDPGVKLIAARHALRARPLEIPLPAIGGQPAPYVEPFFTIHGDHTHAVTSELFPIASAPLIRLFGLRGAYVLPAMAFFVTVAACVGLARALGSSGGLTTALTVALGTPFLFYGLEFWEHVPAVALASGATYVFVTTRREHKPHTRYFAAGLLFGMSTLLRPEALWFAAAVVIASFWLPGARLAAVGWLTAGTAVAVLPLVAYSAVHFGTFVPPHIGSNAGLLRENWLATRADAAARWFVPDALAPGELWGVALVVMIVAGWLTIRPSRSAAFLGVAAVIDILLVMMTTPNDGGGQWGPRYLLFAYVPAALLAAGAVQSIARRRPAGRVVVAAALGLVLLVQRDGYRELRGTKRIYGQILDFVRNETRPGGVVVTDLWWLDQVIAALDDRQILYAPTREVRRDVLRRLDGANAAGAVIIRSSDESPAFSPAEFTVEEFGSSRGYAPTCLTPISQTQIAERTLVATRLQRLAAPCHG
jgi:hypothetical protein